MDAILEDQQSKGGEDSTDKLLRNAAKDIAEYDFEEKTKELKEFKAKAKALKTILAPVPEQIPDRTSVLHAGRSTRVAPRGALHRGRSTGGRRSSFYY